MRYLRANTQVKAVIGPVVAVGDGFTPVTTLSLGSADEAELMKHDAAAVVDISGATFAAITSMDGYYNLTLTTSHTDTEGMILIGINDDSLCLPIMAAFMVLSEAAWDSLYVAKDDGFLDVNVKTIGRADTQETEASNLEAACAAYSATRGLAGTALPAAAADSAGGLPVSDAGGLDLDAKIGALTYGTANRVNVQVYGMETNTLTAAALNADAVTEIQAGLSTYAGADTAGTTTLLARLTALRAGYLDNIDNATLATATFPSDPADQSLVIAATDALLTAITALNNLSAAQAQTAAAAALTAYDPPTNAEMEARTLAAAEYATALALAAAKTVADAILADTGTDGVALSAAICNKIADHVRRRTQANVKASGDGDAVSLGSAYGDIQMKQKASASGAVLTILNPDGSTLGTLSLATDAAADPVTGVS